MMEADKLPSGDKMKNKMVLYSRWKIIAFGQGLSLLLAVMWGSQSILFLRCHWNSPAFSCGWAYLLLATFLVPLIRKGRAIRNGSNTSKVTTWFLSVIPLQGSPWVYLGMAFLSFYGNYCYLLAVSFTTVTSVSMVDALAIPTAMILSHFFLRRRYMRLHLLGAALCISGVMLAVVVDVISNQLYQLKLAPGIQIKSAANATNRTDLGVDDGEDDGSKEYPHKLIGDLLSCAGAILFGINDVMAEMAVRHFGGIHEYLGMLGFFGCLIASVQVAISERQVVVDVFNGVIPGGCSEQILAGILVAFAVGQFCRKVGLAAFLTISDAAFLQLSLLTSDLYTAIISVIFLQITPRSSSWIAMFVVLIGITVYEMAPSPRVDVPLQFEPTFQSGGKSDKNGDTDAVVTMI